MISPRDADHALGLELQIEELVEQRERARVQGRSNDVAAIGKEISALQLELAEAVERATIAGARPDTEPVSIAAPKAGRRRSGRTGKNTEARERRGEGVLSVLRQHVAAH